MKSPLYQDTWAHMFFPVLFTIAKIVCQRQRDKETKCVCVWGGVKTKGYKISNI